MPLAIKDGEKYRIILSEDDQKEFTKLQWCRAQSVFNGVIQRISTYGWEQGYRNNMAVNLMITARMLGITEGDNNKAISDILKENDMFDTSNDKDLEERLDTIEGYVEQWILYNPLAYLLDEDYYIGYANEEGPVEIVFD